SGAGQLGRRWLVGLLLLRGCVPTAIGSDWTRDGKRSWPRGGRDPPRSSLRGAGVFHQAGAVIPSWRRNRRSVVSRGARRGALAVSRKLTCSPRHSRK